MSSTDINKVKFVVYGEPASKANSRRLVTIKGRPAFIKSKKALDYVKAFSEQCPQLDPVMEGDVRVTMTIYYASRRPDLDESVVLDCMQSLTKGSVAKKTKVVLKNNIYMNDRQVKEKVITWGLDKDNPRSEIEVEEIKNEST